MFSVIHKYIKVWHSSVPAAGKGAEPCGSQSVPVENFLEFLVVRQMVAARQKRKQQSYRIESHGRMHEGGVLGCTLHGCGGIERAARGSDDDTAESHLQGDEENSVALHLGTRHAALQIAPARHRRTAQLRRTRHTAATVGDQPLVAVGNDARPG